MLFALSHAEDVGASRGQGGGELSAWTPEPSTSHGFSVHETLANDSLASLPPHEDVSTREGNADQPPPPSPSTDHSEEDEHDADVHMRRIVVSGRRREQAPAADASSSPTSRYVRVLHPSPPHLLLLDSPSCQVVSLPHRPTWRALSPHSGRASSSSSSNVSAVYERRQEKHVGAYFLRPSCVKGIPGALDVRERSEFPR